MTLLHRVLPALLLLAACGAPSAAPAPPTPAASPIDRVEALADAACACADAACATDRDAALAAELRQLPGDYLRARGEQPDTERLTAALGRALDCASRHGVDTTADVQLVVRSIESAAEGACACTDVECALAADAALTRMTEAAAAANLTVAETDRPVIIASIQAARRCMDDVYAPVVERGIAELRELRAAACACTDAACATGVHADLDALAASIDPNIRARADLVDQLHTLDAEITACLDAAAS